MRPVLVGALVVAIGVAFGFNAGYAINPARDLGPRLFTAVGRLGPRRLPGRRRLVVGADGRPVDRRGRSAARSTTSASPGCARPEPRR